MSEQPEALRLATVLENKLGGAADEDIEQAAAELRRLHEEVQAEWRINGMSAERELKLLTEKRELLEVLKFIAGHDLNGADDRVARLIADFMIERARAAIAKAEGETK